jgi:hypothetical protein
VAGIEPAVTICEAAALTFWLHRQLIKNLIKDLLFSRRRSFLFQHYNISKIIFSPQEKNKEKNKQNYF